MKEQLSSFLVLEGFTPVSTNLDDFLIFLKKETGHITVLFVLSLGSEDAFDEERYVNLRDGAIRMLQNKNLPEMHSLFIVLTASVEKAVRATDGDRNAWILDSERKELVIPSNRAEDFYGLKGQLQFFLQDPGRAETLLSDMQKSVDRVVEAKKKADEKNIRKSIPWVSIGIIVMNLIVGLLCIIFGDFLTDALDLDPVAIFDRNQWWRIFTYMYVHGSVTHYLNNMIMLYVQGNILETPMGRIRYAVLYHIFGMLAGLGSLMFKVYSSSTIPSVGASGAIMGLLGVVMYLSIRNIRSLKTGGINRILLLLLCAFSSIYQGFIVPGVDNAAHIAGMLAGIFAGIVWDIMSRRRVKK